MPVFQTVLSELLNTTCDTKMIGSGHHLTEFGQSIYPATLPGQLHRYCSTGHRQEPASARSESLAVRPAVGRLFPDHQGRAGQMVIGTCATRQATPLKEIFPAHKVSIILVY